MANRIPGVGSNTDIRIYTALITQVGTDAPTAIVLLNTLGTTISWARFAAGVYYGTCLELGTFTVNKTWVITNPTIADDSFATIQPISANIIAIQTPDDGVLTNLMIEIRVYK